MGMALQARVRGALTFTSVRLADAYQETVKTRERVSPRHFKVREAEAKLLPSARP